MMLCWHLLTIPPLHTPTSTTHTHRLTSAELQLHLHCFRKSPPFPSEAVPTPPVLCCKPPTKLSPSFCTRGTLGPLGLLLPGVGPWRQVRRVTEKPLWACFRLWASWRRAWGWWGLSPTAALDLRIQGSWRLEGTDFFFWGVGRQVSGARLEKRTQESGEKTLKAWVLWVPHKNLEVDSKNISWLMRFLECQLE